MVASGRGRRGGWWGCLAGWDGSAGPREGGGEDEREREGRTVYGGRYHFLQDWRAFGQVDADGDGADGVGVG